MSNGILPSFLGALQASLTVLLTISYGGIASRFNLLKESSARDISKVCVRLFLPALLITNVGNELHLDTASKYIPVLVWALVYTLSSMALGWVLKRAFKFPAWTVPAICFNNTTALPLLLIQSLETAGILGDLLKSKDDTTSDAVSRAKSYFLVCATVGNSLTFAFGPKLLDDEESPDKEEKKDDVQNDENGRDIHQESDEEHANPVNNAGRTAEEQEEHANETTTLLPQCIARPEAEARDEVAKTSEKYWERLPKAVKQAFSFLGSFLNAPLIGAVIGAIIGLAPPLHKAFFSEPDEGGFLNAWLTASLKNVGELFAALQLVVVGSKLSAALLKMKRGEASGSLPLIPVFSVLFIRLLLWPVISIGVIYAIASKTNWLSDDPVLWFVLMLMPTGPPATKLTALADVSNATEDEKMSVAKFLALAYAVSPVICFAVVGALKASVALQS